MLLVTIAALVGCSSEGRSSASKEPADGSGNTTVDTEVSLRLEPLDVNLVSPVAAIPIPTSDSMIVAERAGTVRLLTFDGEDATASSPILDIGDEVSTDFERGLLGVAISLDAKQLFLSYTTANDGTSVVVAYAITVSEDGGAENAGERPEVAVDEDSKRILVSVPQPYANHNGGNIAFGPDGMLYLGLGDGGAGGDPEGNAQNPSSLLGKILRIDPAAGESDGDRPEIWLSGVRNPWRFSFDSKTGDLWIGDVGQDKWEEIDLLPKATGMGEGTNLGWDLFEGDQKFADANPGPGDASKGPFVKPVFTYSHDPGCSVTGGVVYRGQKIPDLNGMYLYSDYCDGRIFGLRTDGPATEDSEFEQVDLGIELSQVISFATDSSDEVYVLSLDKGIARIVAE